MKSRLLLIPAGFALTYLEYCFVTWEWYPQTWGAVCRWGVLILGGFVCDVITKRLAQ